MMPAFHIALHLALNLLGGVLVLATLPLVAELLVLSSAAILPPARIKAHETLTLRLAVVVPAHNEEQLIAACVRSLKASRYAPSAIYVVAHNCTDATAENAKLAGATVLVLNETSGHGKGAALDHGFHHALHGDADAVLVIDADSTVATDTTALIATALQQGAAAAQCRYIAANTTTPRTRLQALALVAINVLRPRGRARLGLSCGIFGNGFALSRRTLAGLPYTSHSIVEDVEYHLALVRAGMRVVFVDDAHVAGEMPEGSSAAATQRARWEGGRQLLRRRLTMPMLRSVLCGELRLVEPLLELLARPTASVAMCLLLSLALPLPWLRLYAVVGLAAMTLSVIVAAGLSEEGLASLGALAYVPAHIFFKLRQRAKTRRAAAKDAAWVRTPRNPHASA
ncbi:Glycosyltransferase, catalytic subunit of cellulose synthase and poly-beta-1,6-N-acetylglucosamine synthase [Bryocella elongata]|uniref:Glycosyltransferase, catalytic subunit of cellulose synthase and poly-beta-1,6-N-acetylglucosamine synthase n=1 Tax=Bryocella elongata TaxID=863522 RepID=A0A1H6AUS5_9BACT|nr:glycosyltransferase family 2 protein [Bryocella elongata]SEG52388.1 Glycosyltransferase, catalytic subunit of cellulose synthase and poly-beta-1,6-N-acetylglucosamine synthase [Bryocella elongata]